MGLEWAGESAPKQPERTQQPLPTAEEIEDSQEQVQPIELPAAIVPEPKKVPHHIDTSQLPRSDSTNPNERWHDNIQAKRFANHD